MTRPQLWVAAGPNGAGKSTLVSRRLAHHLPVVNPDVIAAGIQPEGPADVKILAGRAAVRQREALLSAEQGFAIETTLTGNSEIDLIRRAAAAGYKTNLVYVGVQDVALSTVRVLQRTLSGGHDVPIEDILRRFERSLANLAVALPLVDRSWVVDNSGERRRLLLSRDTGLVKHCAKSWPAWALRAIPPHLRRRDGA